jgi:membrane protease YdiL (CAAX protease family)
MRPLRSTLIYTAGVFLGAAFMAPLLYHAGQVAAAHWPWLQGLAEQPFRRYVNRSLLALAILGLWPWLRMNGLSSWRDIGMAEPFRQWKLIGGGFALGFATLAVAAFAAIWADQRDWNLSHAPALYARHLAKAGAAALVVALLEEILFRGALFGVLRRQWQGPRALILSSILFAFLHFLDYRPAAPETVTWLSGLRILPEMLRPLAWGQWFPLLPNLILVGAILAWLYQITGSLAASIGLHAGWIFWVKSYGFLTMAPATAPHALWGTSRLIDGWCATLLLGIVLAGLVRADAAGKEEIP